MNTNIILDGLNAMLKQLIAAAIAEAIKPLEERIAVLEDNLHAWEDTRVEQDNRIAVLEGKGSEWTAMEHVAAKAVQPVLNRLTALEINQTLVSSAKVDFNEAIRDVLDGYNFIKRNDVVDLVDKVVENAIDNYDFSESFDFENAIENYDFREIVEGSMPEDDEALTQDKVQEMIDEALDNLTISRN
jgi:hypothetical protein